MDMANRFIMAMLNMMGSLLMVSLMVKASFTPLKESLVTMGLTKTIKSMATAPKLMKMEPFNMKVTSIWACGLDRVNFVISMVSNFKKALF